MVVNLSPDKLVEILRQSSNHIVKDSPKLDLDSYIQNYSGRTRWSRLYLLGSTSITLCVEALKAAVIEAKKGQDVERYQLAQEKLFRVAPDQPESLIDADWIDRTTKQNKAETDHLEANLKGYKNNLIKESVRLGNKDLGDHYLAIGDLPKAFEAYSRMRQDVSVNQHIIQISKYLIAVSMEMRNWLSVLGNVHKLATTPEPTAEAEITGQPYRMVAAGIAHMAGGKFYEAAQKFLAVKSGVGSSINYLVSANDIAVYGGLCALASMDRDQLQKQVLDCSTFRTYLELEPHIRRAVSFFVNSRYSACLSTLEGYRNDYLLDIYLQPQVEEIYSLIRSKAIVQYFIPFSCVTLDSLNEAFAPTGGSIENELLSMIKQGSLQARIDTQNRTLVTVPKTPRATVQSQTLASAKAYEREMRNRIIRMNIIQADLEVRGNPKKSMDQTQGQGQGKIASFVEDLMFPSSRG